MRIENETQVNESIAKLKKVIKLTRDNSFLADVNIEAKKALEIAERCVNFGIYTESNALEYGCGIYIMVGSINDTRYNPEKPEELLKISFPTGAYIFGKRYDVEYFDKFFEELKNCEPDYIDTLNNALYYKPQNARRAWEHYKTVYKKYMDGNKERQKEWKLEQAKKEYERLLKESKGE